MNKTCIQRSINLSNKNLPQKRWLLHPHYLRFTQVFKIDSIPGSVKEHNIKPVMEGDNIIWK